MTSFGEEPSARPKFLRAACYANLGLFITGTFILGLSSSTISSSSLYLDFYLISGNYNLSDFSTRNVEVCQSFP
jgi:hypothetical protein